MGSQKFHLQIARLLCVFTLLFLLCLFWLNFSLISKAKSQASRSTAIVSIASDGSQGNGDSYFPSISADGRFVAFVSMANNFTDTPNFNPDVFVHDTQTGQTTLISEDTLGEESSGTFPSISGDGRFVAFYSGYNLVGSDPLYVFSVYVRDLQTDQITLASVGLNGAFPDKEATRPSISYDGRFVAYVSSATNLVSNDTNNLDDIFVFDRQIAQTVRVSVSSLGEEANGDSTDPKISASGRYVVFKSVASNLVSNDNNSDMDIFVHDLLTGETKRVSISTEGIEANAQSDDPSISADGRYIAFSSSATNLDPNDIDYGYGDYGDVFIHDTQSGTTRLISNFDDQFKVNVYSFPQISADGQQIAFAARPCPIFGACGYYNIYKYNRETFAAEQISIGENGEPANRDSGLFGLSISSNGSFVAYDSLATNLVANDHNEFRDVFIFTNQQATDCDPNDFPPGQDTDGDGLLDYWEICGYTHTNGNFVDLPAMGADPNIKDIFVEVDYMVDHGEFKLGIWNRGHTHKPKASAIEAVVQTFNNQAGIHLHVDYGRDAPLTWGKTETWGNLSQGEELEEQEFLQPTNEIWDWSGFDHIKNSQNQGQGQGHFSQERTPIFHYAIFAHYLGGDNSLGTSGATHTRGNDCPSFRLGASDFVVATGGAKNPEGTSLQQAGIFLHELGHNLGLCHGGDDNQSFEPNYLSVMNYSYQMDGLTIKQPDGTYQEGFLNYSIFGNVIPNLVETDLNEQIGMGGSPPFDTYGISYFCRHQGIWEPKWITDTNQINWDCEDGYEASVVANINDGDKDSPNQLLTVLTGAYDDWAHLVYDGGLVGGDKTSNQPVEYLASDSQVQNTTIEELTFETAENLYRPYSIAIGPSYDLVISPGINTTFPITLTNTGALTATVTLSPTFNSDWFELSSIPDILTLASGETISIPIDLNIPSSTSPGEMQQITINALLKESPLMGDSITLKATVGPMAWYEAEPVIGNSPLIVTFRDISIGEYDSWLWDFGDGFQSIDQNPTHTYTKPGIYTVSLKVTGPNGSDIYERKDLITVGSWFVYIPILRN